MFSINVLLYGDHTPLALRCLRSLTRVCLPEFVTDVRIGTNDVCDDTLQLMQDFADCVNIPVHRFSERTTGRNVMKYPLMRRMFYDDTLPLKAERVLWLDDDSYLDVSDGEGWWNHIERLFMQWSPAVIGSQYRPAYQWTATEKAAFKKQPWFKRYEDTMPSFMTGGGWLADMAFLRQWDYPVRELKHNGGDVLLGEICRQQGRRIHTFKGGMHINADAAGKESKAKRRGLSTKRPFQEPPPYDYSHHDFELMIGTL